MWNLHINFLTMVSISFFSCCKKYMNDWEKFSETLLLEKENFYNHLNMKDITDDDYTHTKIVCKDENKK